jgi:hypothetical protein
MFLVRSAPFNSKSMERKWFFRHLACNDFAFQDKTFPPCCEFLISGSGQTVLVQKFVREQL